MTFVSRSKDEEKKDEEKKEKEKKDGEKKDEEKRNIGLNSVYKLFHTCCIAPPIQ